MVFRGIANLFPFPIFAILLQKRLYEKEFTPQLSRSCFLRLTDLNNPLVTVKSPMFRIKGYILTRINFDDEYEAFDPTKDTWQFKNDSTNMWPQSWYNQFNYYDTDPYTKQKYPKTFGK